MILGGELWGYQADTWSVTVDIMEGDACATCCRIDNNACGLVISEVIDYLLAVGLLPTLDTVTAELLT
jgi:hypothetical protein